MEQERELADLLRAVEAALAEGLIQRAREQEGPVELGGQDLHQDLVVVGAAVEGEEPFHHRHVLDDFVERLVIAGLRGLGLAARRLRRRRGLALGGLLFLLRKGLVANRGARDQRQRGDDRRQHPECACHGFLLGRLRPDRTGRGRTDWSGQG